MSGDEVGISQGRYAYSRKDRDIDDVMSAANFTYGTERDTAAFANRLQLDALRLVASAPELLAARELAQECLKNHNKYSHLGNGYLEEADEIITSAITKARGQ